MRPLPMQRIARASAVQLQATVLPTDTKQVSTKQAYPAPGTGQRSIGGLLVSSISIPAGVSQTKLQRDGSDTSAEEILQSQLTASC